MVWLISVCAGIKPVAMLFVFRLIKLCLNLRQLKLLIHELRFVNNYKP